jgi:hypothetical protein
MPAGDVPAGTSAESSDDPGPFSASDRPEAFSARAGELFMRLLPVSSGAADSERPIQGAPRLPLLAIRTGLGSTSALWSA